MLFIMKSIMWEIMLWFPLSMLKLGVVGPLAPGFRVVRISHIIHEDRRLYGMYCIQANNDNENMFFTKVDSQNKLLYVLHSAIVMVMQGIHLNVIAS